jgi:hypothetical protein
MSFRITGLAPDRFRPLFGLSDAALAAHGARRYIADAKPGFPDRVELRDADPGEAVLLVNFVHQPADTPYRASHAIFVREGAAEAYDRIDEVPDSLRRPAVSLRAFDAADMMIDAEVVDGKTLEAAIERLLANRDATYLHAHYAARGCYAARVQRA